MHYALLHTQTAKHHGCNEFVSCCMPRLQSTVFHIAFMANTQMSLSHSRYLQCYLKIPTSMVLCGLGMQQYAMHNATIQKTTIFEFGVYSHSTKYICTQDIILHPCSNCICSFSKLYLFNFKEMIYLLTIK